MPFNNITDEATTMMTTNNKNDSNEKKQIHEDLSSGNSSSGVSEDEEHDYNRVLKKLKGKQTQVNRMSGDENDQRLLSLPSESHETFLRTLFDDVLKKAIFDGTKRENKVLEWTDPEELSRKFNMELKDEPDNDETLLKLANDTIKYSVKTGHPFFVNQLFSCVDPFGFAGQIITDALNPSVYTYEVSPVFILMEEVVLKEMRKIVGYEAGQGDGIFCPGGSAANGYAISCARFFTCPDVKVG